MLLENIFVIRSLEYSFYICFTPIIPFNAQPDAIKLELAVRQEPLLVFVNGRSGGNQGLDLLTKFRHYLNPHQVFDIANGGPHVGYDRCISHV